MAVASVKTSTQNISERLELTVPSLATVTDMRDLAHNIKLIQVRLDDPQIREKFIYEPGQFAELSIFGVGESPFGLASSSDGDVLEFAVARVGSLTDALFRLDVGDQVGIRGPLGIGFPMHEYKGQRRPRDWRRDRRRTAAPHHSNHIRQPAGLRKGNHPVGGQKSGITRFYRRV